MVRETPGTMMLADSCRDQARTSCLQLRKQRARGVKSIPSTGTMAEEDILQGL